MTTSVNHGLYGPLLQYVANADVDLRKISEPTRQRLIDMAMTEPPLVDVDADRVFLTDDGRSALAAYEAR